MTRIELPFDVRPVWLRRLILIFLISWMASYSIYTSYYRAYAVDTYDRFLDHQAGRSMFFNPWQYRVLCPWMIGGIYQVLDHTVFPLVNIKGFHLHVQGNTVDKNPNTVKLMKSLENPDFVKYTLVFLGFRFLEDVIILLLAYSYLRVFVSSVNVRWLALTFISLAMGNSVVDSDLTFNTYMDIIVYLSAGLVIMKNLNYWWIAGITIAGAFNRETSVFIPAIFFFSKTDWSSWPSFRKMFFLDRRAFVVTACATVLFFAIFFGIRYHYGLRPLETWRVPPGLPMLKLNFLSASAIKTYMEFFGVFAIFPIWAIFVLKTADHRLRIIFYTLVPAWFALHLYSAIGFQTRLFLVPTVLVIIPVVFEYIDKKMVALSPSQPSQID
jgi:hypothetical protein